LLRWLAATTGAAPRLLLTCGSCTTGDALHLCIIFIISDQSSHSMLLHVCNNMPVMGIWRWCRQTFYTCVATEHTCIMYAIHCAMHQQSRSNV
jgi:hypothetical protein